MPEPLDSREDYDALVRAVAVKLAAEEKVPLTAKHFNRAKRQLWPKLSERLQGELVMR